MLKFVFRWVEDNEEGEGYLRELFLIDFDESVTEEIRQLIKEMATAASKKVLELRIFKQMISLLFGNEKLYELISTILEEMKEEANDLDKDFFLSSFANSTED